MGMPMPPITISKEFVPGEVEHGAGAGPGAAGESKAKANTIQEFVPGAGAHVKEFVPGAGAQPTEFVPASQYNPKQFPAKEFVPGTEFVPSCGAVDGAGAPAPQLLPVSTRRRKNSGVDIMDKSKMKGSTPMGSNPNMSGRHANHGIEPQGAQ